MTFSEQAESYFQQYRELSKKISDIDREIKNLEVRKYELSNEKRTMAEVIVHHIEHGDDIMTCLMKLASNTETSTLSNPGIQLRGMFTTGAYDGSRSHGAYGSPSILSSMTSMTAINAFSGPTNQAILTSYSQNAGWKQADIGLGSIDIYDPTGQSGPSNPKVP